ncbi:molybdopterin oxidoreductase family protein [Pseudogemmatithrix spongiicola]|uniref:Molybdopterin oxidoreductase family protein n=1 Tax=Pseudogemmatithrix spongiicola TaxID=3062599 RepID=A0AA49Q3R7_9BACT|nr:molybdopterin oxidoreductase family protein [Gemmatimonadaceae bacterium 'strain 138']WKW14066.1 molybdopterin oxidoreductase family protein [Gemmatimonadaceae bacterium 'strain 318']
MTATVVRGACPHDCPDTCATLVTVEDGRATRIQGDKDHPFTQGFLCTKVNRYLERTYHADRVLTPLKRVGPKGPGATFVEASWDEALDAIAARLNAIRASADGPQSILPYSYAGTMGLLQGESIDRRFFHLMGASKLDRTICATAGMWGMRMTVGASIGADAELVPESDLVILWGTNTLTSNPHLWPKVLEARAKGTPVICIDPIRTRTAEQCDEWIGIRPGTDAALALGLMHVIFAEGLQDDDYLTQYTLGAEQLHERVKRYPPEKVAEITGVPAERIVTLAREYAKAKAAYVRINYGLQRHGGGAMAVRTIACLPAVVGHWRRPAGGVHLSSSANFAFNRAMLHREDLSPAGTRTINMSLLGDALTKPDAGVGGPPVKALVVYNSNPAAIAPDFLRVIEGFKREDLFVVVLEHFRTDTADYADWILPATTQLEHWDIHFSYGHLYASLNKPAIAPVGQALPNTEIFRRLAARMGLEHESLRDDDVTLVKQALDSQAEALKGLSFEELEKHGWLRLNLPKPYVPFARGGFRTPSGKCEFFSQRMADMGLDPLPDFTPPHEFPEQVPALAAKYPITLISSPAHQFLNSTFVNIGPLQRAAKEPEVSLHPRDAERRGIHDGQMVIVENDRGHFTARARLREGIREAVAWAPGIWWAKLSTDGRNVNAVTSQKLTDMGAGPTFYDCLVEIRAAD